MPDSGMHRWAHPAVILVATDLNDLDRLLPLAIEQGTQTGARIILLHVIADILAFSADGAGLPYYDPASAFETAAKTLETSCAQARGEGVTCDGLVREGNPAQQILAAARQFNADRVLLGTRGKSKLTRLVLGSVAEQVLRSVNLPVITVGPEAHRGVDGSTTEQVVLHATTLSEASRPSAALVCQVAALLHAKVVLLHVLPHIDEMERLGLPAGLESAAMQQLSAMAEEMSCSALKVEPRVVHGNPSIEILAEAEQRHAKLIVLGATNRSAFENLTRDRTVYKVMAHARCPVMTLRECHTREEMQPLTRTVLHF